MRPCSEDPQLCWTSWLLGFISLLLSICSTGAKSPGARGSEIQDSGARVPLQGIRGGSVLFHVIKKQEDEPEEVSWGFGPKSNYSVLLQVRRGADTPTWVSLQDKYQHRVHVPNNLSLKIENLTCEDSGHYRARVSFTGGLELTQIFLLTVYEPVPSPQILMGSASITPDWCNVTLECRASGATEDLNVTWEYKGLPEEWEQRRTLESASNSRILAVSLPRGQPHASLVCVVSNPVGYKTASFDLGRDCVHDSAKQVNADLLPGILGAVAAVLLILGGGLYLWKTRRKKMETGRGRSQDDDDDSIQCAELSQEESQQSSNKCKASENREDLKVTWESKGLPRELVWRTLGPAANSQSLPVSLPLNQPSASLTWVVSNPVDQKTATSDLGESVPMWEGRKQVHMDRPVLTVIVAGLWLCCGSREVDCAIESEDPAWVLCRAVPTTLSKRPGKTTQVATPAGQRPGGCRCSTAHQGAPAQRAASPFIPGNSPVSALRTAPPDSDPSAGPAVVPSPQACHLVTSFSLSAFPSRSYLCPGCGLRPPGLKKSSGKGTPPPPPGFEGRRSGGRGGAGGDQDKRGADSARTPLCSGPPGAHGAGAAGLRPLIRALCPGRTRLAHTASPERRDVQGAPSPLLRSLGDRSQLGLMRVSPHRPPVPPSGPHPDGAALWASEA
ncbi:unnamed protein product [Rangifer tarandus platyrhynchus]|uniref:Ig-like domain-containing protein n=1 Tax=Rangifer tarandus platyrhynchus TaxID=3082113 RepID=A0ABN8XUH0_RANTA|nr:unnamed protein product [Rangifer tarandus platyrhynchus]